MHNLDNDKWKTSVLLDVACEYIFCGSNSMFGFLLELIEPEIIEN